MNDFDLHRIVASLYARPISQKTVSELLEDEKNEKYLFYDAVRIALEFNRNSKENREIIKPLLEKAKISSEDHEHKPA